MDKQFQPLFTPFKIGNTEIKNRIVLCPMGGTSIFGWMEPHHFDKDASDFFLTLAKNNVGLIIPGIAPIRNMIGGGWLYKANGAFKKLKPFMDEIHKTGAKLFVQLTAGFGRSFSIPESMSKIAQNKIVRKLIKPIIDIDRLTASPSVLPSRWLDGFTCRALTIKEIQQMVTAFGKTALKCKEAGVDGVEIHAVHEGYLLDQFTLAYTNHRTDEYGGSFENRYRFATNIVKEIKRVCGSDYPVSLRYSVVSKTKDFCKGAVPGETFVELGRDMAESEKAARYLQDAGFDMLNCDNGTYDAWYWAHPPAYMPQNCNLADVAHIKKFVTIPVVCAGRMTPAEASRAIKNGDIDAMGVARQFLTDPLWVTKLKEDRLEDIMPCICCHNGCFPMAHYKGVACDATMEDSAHMARCALNPQMMDGGKYDFKPAKKRKTIAIIGGGIGGMEVARVATMRGHKAIIYEKSDHLGGVFVPAAAPSFKEKDRQLIAWYLRQMKELNIEIHLNSEVRNIKEIWADEIVIATGSTPRKLKIHGGNKAIDALDYLSGASVGNRVAVIGGGLTGCEIAYDLYLKGKTPIIIEAKDDLVKASGVCLANSSFLRDFFDYAKVPVYLQTTLKEIGKDNITIVGADEIPKTVKADSVILAIGYNSAPLAKPSRHVHIVGDALRVGNLRTVIWRAWDVATKL